MRIQNALKLKFGENRTFSDLSDTKSIPHNLKTAKAIMSNFYSRAPSWISENVSICCVECNLPVMRCRLMIKPCFQLCGMYVAADAGIWPDEGLRVRCHRTQWQDGRPDGDYRTMYHAAGENSHLQVFCHTYLQWAEWYWVWGDNRTTNVDAVWLGDWRDIAMSHATQVSLRATRVSRDSFLLLVCVSWSTTYLLCLFWLQSEPVHTGTDWGVPRQATCSWHWRNVDQEQELLPYVDDCICLASQWG